MGGWGVGVGWVGGLCAVELLLAARADPSRKARPGLEAPLILAACRGSVRKSCCCWV